MTNAGRVQSSLTLDPHEPVVTGPTGIAILQGNLNFNSCLQPQVFPCQTNELIVGTIKREKNEREREKIKDFEVSQM